MLHDKHNSAWYCLSDNPTHATGVKALNFTNTSHRLMDIDQ